MGLHTKYFKNTFSWDCGLYSQQHAALLRLYWTKKFWCMYCSGLSKSHVCIEEDDVDKYVTDCVFSFLQQDLMLLLWILQFAIFFLQADSSGDK